MLSHFWLAGAGTNLSLCCGDMDAVNTNLFQQDSTDLTPAVPYFGFFVMLLWMYLVSS
jgi:hypothetical protein